MGLRPERDGDLVEEAIRDEGADPQWRRVLQAKEREVGQLERSVQRLGAETAPPDRVPDIAQVI